MHIEGLAAHAHKYRNHDRLMCQAMQRSCANTKGAAVQTALKLLIDIHAQSAIRRLARQGTVES